MKSHVCATLALLGILLVAVLLEGCAAVKLKLNAGEEECLATTLELEQSQLSKQSILTIDGALSVVGPTGKPNYNQRRSVDVVIMSPSGQELYNAPGVWKDFKFNMGASEIGTYKLCITAAATVRNAVTVAVDFFTVTHEDTAERDGLPAGARTPPPPPAELASQLHLTQVHDLVLRVGKQLERLTGEQRHFRSRLKRHMQTNQAMHGRAFMYFALEASVVLLLAAVQVTTVHAMFRNRRGNQGFLGA